MPAVKTRIRKNDIVQLIAGDHVGKRHVGKDQPASELSPRGKVLSVNRETGKATVEGMNIVYRHQRLSRNPAKPNVGRIEKEAPIPLSRLMLVCQKCDKATRTGVRLEEVADAQGRARQRSKRVCKECGEVIEERI